MKKNKRWMMLAIYGATFMTAIESTIVVTAANDIFKSFNNQNDSVSLLFSSYLFASAIATPFLSHWADQIGKKKIFLFGLALFTLGTMLCGLSTSYLSLIIFRVIQGIGSGGILPITFALIGDLFDLEQRGKIMGLNNSAWGIASLIAPLLGGMLVSNFTWHWIFFINIPFGIAVFLIVFFVYHEKKQPIKKEKNSHYLRQQVIFAVLLFLMLTSIQLMTTNLLLGALLFLFGCGLLWGFIKLERKEKMPILPLTTFRKKNFLLFVAVIFLINGALIGFQVYVPLWVQTELHFTPTLAGLALLPSSILFITGSYFSAQLAGYFGKKKILLLSLTLILGIFGVMSFLPASASYLILLLLAGFSGLGIGLAFTISLITAQSNATEENISTVSGFITLCRTLGQSFMITLLGIFYSFGFTHDSQTLTGYHLVFLFSALIIGGILFLILPRKIENF
ncbi:MFS transporter [Enterococcus massiliensis]|uniref:MFS transporter n=1 Tax=Enterococcus massiliensis TaxID=1640685 RepID=UPI00065E4F41|nr:MFS transporter [Enterococcus massiliensis]